MAAKKKTTEEKLVESINDLNATIKGQNKTQQRLERSFEGFAMWNAQDSLYEVFSQSMEYQTRAISLGKSSLQVQQENNENLKDLNTGLGIKLEEQLNALESGLHGELKGTMRLATRMNSLGENTNLLWAAMSQQRVLLGMSNKQMDNLADTINESAEANAINREKLVGALQMLGRSLAGLSLSMDIGGVQEAQTALMSIVGAAYDKSLPQVLGPIFEAASEGMYRDIKLAIQEPLRRLTSGGSSPDDLIEIFNAHLGVLENFLSGVSDPSLAKARTEQAARFMNTTAENLAVMKSIVANYEAGTKKEKDVATQRAETFAKTFADFQSEVLTPLMQVLIKATNVFTNIITDAGGLLKTIGYLTATVGFGAIGDRMGMKMFGVAPLAGGIAKTLLKAIPILGTGVMAMEILGLDPISKVMDLIGGQSEKQTDLLKRDSEQQEKQTRIATASLKEIQEQNKPESSYEGTDIHSLNKEIINRMFLIQNESMDMRYNEERASYQRDLLRAQQEKTNELLDSLNRKMATLNRKGPINNG